MKNNEKVSIQELLGAISDRSGVSKKMADDFLRAMQAAIDEALVADGVVKIKGLGTFKLQWNEPRKSVNVRTKEEYIIPGHNKVVFIPEPQIRDEVNAPYADLKSVEVKGADENTQEEEQIKKLREQAEEIKDLLSVFSSSQTSVVEVTDKLTDDNKAEASVVQPISSNEDDEVSIIPPKPIENYDLGERELPIKTKKKRYLKLLEKCIIAFAFFVLLGVLGYIEYETQCFSSFGARCYTESKQKITSWHNTFLMKNSNDVEAPIVKKSVLNKPKKDTIQNVIAKNSQQDIATNKNQIVEKKTVVVKSKSENATFIFDKKRVYKEFIATEKLEKGSRLTLISEKYYGHRDFWVYIYEANRAVISHPDNVKPGLIVKVPKLDAALIDIKNPQCLQYAKELHDKYVAK